MADVYERTCFRSHLTDARYAFKKNYYIFSCTSFISELVASFLFVTDKHPSLQHVNNFWPRHRPRYNPTLQEYCRGWQRKPGIIICIIIINASTMDLSVNDCHLSELLKYFVCVHFDVFVCPCYMYLFTHLCTCASHREATAAVKHLRGFIGTYYEDHIQPVTDSYVEWASNVKSTVWEKIQTTIDKLIPLKATNQTAQPTQIWRKADNKWILLPFFCNSYHLMLNSSCLKVSPGFVSNTEIIYNKPLYMLLYGPSLSCKKDNKRDVKIITEYLKAAIITIM